MKERAPLVLLRSRARAAAGVALVAGLGLAVPRLHPPPARTLTRTHHARLVPPMGFDTPTGQLMPGAAGPAGWATAGPSRRRPDVGNPRYSVGYGRILLSWICLLLTVPAAAVAVGRLAESLDRPDTGWGPFGWCAGTLTGSVPARVAVIACGVLAAPLLARAYYRLGEGVRIRAMTVLVPLALVAAMAAIELTAGLGLRSTC